MTALKAICVFCGHRPGIDPKYIAAAAELGRMLGERGIELVYGGGHMGMMGALSDAAMAAGGRVVGIIPEFLTHIEDANPNVTELVTVDDMDTRKHQMFARAQGFIVLPGGFGTVDETFEAVTLNQLGVHDKPIALANVNGFFDPWKALIEGLVLEGFCAPEHARMLKFTGSVDEALDHVVANVSDHPDRPGLPG